MESPSTAEDKAAAAPATSSVAPDSSRIAPPTRAKSASVPLSDYEDPATIARFEPVALSIRSKSEDDLGFSVIDVTERGLSLLAGQLRLFGEVSLGRSSDPESRPVTKIPHKLFDDFSPGGALEVMLSTCLRFKATNALRRLDFQNMDKRALYLNLYRLVVNNLLAAKLLPRFSIYFSRNLPPDICDEVRPIVSYRANIVTSPAEATHIVYADPADTTPAETDGKDYCRTIQLVPPLALVHWWYHPDSYDSWIPIADVQGDPEPEQHNLGPWHVQVRWLHDTHLFNEWMNELDYEIGEELREKFNEDSRVNARLISKKKKPGTLHARHAASPLDVADLGKKSSKKRKRADSLKADRSSGERDAREREGVSQDDTLGGSDAVNVDDTASKLEGGVERPSTTVRESDRRSEAREVTPASRGHSLTEGDKDRPKDRHRNRDRDRGSEGKHDADRNLDGDRRRDRDRDRNRERSRHREGKAGNPGDLKHLGSGKHERTSDGDVSRKSKSISGKTESRRRRDTVPIEGAEASPSARGSGQPSKRMKTVHEDGKTKTPSDCRSLKVRINMPKRPGSNDSSPSALKSMGDEVLHRPDLKVRVRMPTMPSSSDGRGESVENSSGKVLDGDHGKSHGDDDGSRRGRAKGLLGDTDVADRSSRRGKSKKKDKRGGHSRNIGVSVVENADPIAEADIRRIRNISMDVSNGGHSDVSYPSDPALATTDSADGVTRSEHVPALDGNGDVNMTGDVGGDIGPQEVPRFRSTAVAAEGLDGTIAGAPVSAADLVESLPQVAVRVPAQACWFRFDSIHDLEKRSCPEFFNTRSSSKTPGVYKTYRDFMVDTWRQAPNKYMTATSVRRHLAGDVCGILRVHAFLEHWGLINFGVVPESRPVHGSLKGIRPESWNATPVVEQPSHTGAATSGAESAIPRLLFFDEVPPSRKSAPPTSLEGLAGAALYKPKSEVPLATRREIYASAAALEYACDACGKDCSRMRYHCVGQADIDLCPTCFADGQYPSMLAARDFEQLTTVATSDAYNGSVWSEAEVLLLLEGLEKFGDDWNSVADHVGTKSNEQCVMQFLRMPIEDSFLGDQLGKWGRGGRECGTAEAVASGRHAFADAPMPFADTSNPVMAQIAFLASSVAPEVAAAAAQAALTKIMSDTNQSPSSVVKEQRSALAGALVNGDSNQVSPQGALATSSQGNGVADNENAAATSPVPKVDTTSVAKAEDAPVEHPNGVALDQRIRGLRAGDFSSPPSTKDPSGNDNTQGQLSPIGPGAQISGRSPSHIPGVELDSAAVQASAAVGLAAAASRAKALANGEMRELERVFGVVIETKLRVIEEKLKSFSDMERVVRAERDKLQRERESLRLERVGERVSSALARTQGTVADLQPFESGPEAVPRVAPPGLSEPTGSPKNEEAAQADPSPPSMVP